MSTLVLTIILAFIIIIFALIGLGIGLLITGKSKIRGGTCGRDPTKKRSDEDCGTDSACHLCDQNKENK